MLQSDIQIITSTIFRTQSFYAYHALCKILLLVSIREIRSPLIPYYPCHRFPPPRCQTALASFRPSTQPIESVNRSHRGSSSISRGKDQTVFPRDSECKVKRNVEAGKRRDEAAGSSFHALRTVNSPRSESIGGKPSFGRA